MKIEEVEQFANCTISLMGGLIKKNAMLEFLLYLIAKSNIEDLRLKYIKSIKV